jgi:hypothetical protein
VRGRDVDVMLEAAAADAAARAETTDEPLPPVRRAGPRPPDPGERVGSHDGSQQPVPSPREQRQASVPWVGNDEVPDAVDVTDELPRLGGHSRSQDAEGPERDDLRTTAQLAILLDDLEARRDRT